MADLREKKKERRNNKLRGVNSLCQERVWNRRRCLANFSQKKEDTHTHTQKKEKKNRNVVDVCWFIDWTSFKMMDEAYFFLFLAFIIFLSLSLSVAFWLNYVLVTCAGLVDTVARLANCSLWSTHLQQGRKVPSSTRGRYARMDVADQVRRLDRSRPLWMPGIDFSPCLNTFIWIKYAYF